MNRIPAEIKVIYHHMPVETISETHINHPCHAYDQKKDFQVLTFGNPIDFLSAA